MLDISTSTQSISVLLMDGFSLLSLSSFLEPLRYARDKYPDLVPRVTLVGVEGKRAAAQCGIELTCDMGLEEFSNVLEGVNAPRALVICGGFQLPERASSNLRAVLRRAVARGVALSALGGANWVLAQIGLLDGERGTIHWRFLHAMSESYDRVEVSNALYVVNDNITSCAGELATIDFVIELLAQISPRVASETACQFLMSVPRGGAMPQPVRTSDQLRNLPYALADAIDLMVENIEDPLAISELARQCGVSSRQLERLFQQHLSSSPKNYYTKIKLDYAHQLVAQTNIELREVALACGFSSTGLLARKFRDRFLLTPTQLRNKLDGQMVEHPAI